MPWRKPLPPMMKRPPIQPPTRSCRMSLRQSQTGKTRRQTRLRAVRTCSPPRARTLFTQLGVADLADSYPRELSGGEMRRVSIARALMNQPSLLIADEPTGDLDQESTDIAMRLLRRQANNGTAILMVTHDPRCTRIRRSGVSHGRRKRLSMSLGVNGLAGVCQQVDTVWSHSPSAGRRAGNRQENRPVRVYSRRSAGEARPALCQAYARQASSVQITTEGLIQ